ncbi:protoporphyrinogen oxidase [Roseiconus nitratireducens]|uniref:Coproporphyrinogen III oxidase n=1 Tax=Roseiconus nitratireducens TaxID=2605748 RepID=A0A5M6D108_9BACT|nr:protoporphyrinogen oxidase [Roseiconus nitratireducens]KAA5539299.1 protoporphyrinogen oxidase [Roseiconus nitratireducens]
MVKRIAVIGGGLSGLTTAFYAKRYAPDSEVTVLESSSHLGGVIGTERVEIDRIGSFLIDRGADMFATDPPAAMELCRDLGVEQKLLIPQTDRAGVMIVCRGKLIPIPDGFVLMRATKLWQMITTPILSIRGKLRFLAERWVKPNPPGNSQSQGAASDDQSVADFVRQRMGQEVLDRLVGPLIAGIYTADIEKLSMNATMAPMVAMVREHGSLAKATLARRRAQQDATERQSAGARYEKFRGFPEGMAELIDALAAAIGEESIHLNARVQSLRYAPGDRPAWQLQWDQQTETFDEVVLATPAAVSARLLHSVAERDGDALAEIHSHCRSAADGLASIESASTAIVVLGVPKKVIRRLPDKFGIVVPACEHRSILAISFASHKYANRCPADHTLIRVFIGGATQSELLRQSDQQLIELVRRELADLIGLQGSESIARVVRWNNAMPQYHVGHQELASRVESAVDAIPALSLATNALRGVGISPVIANAKRVARRITAAAIP